ncbi:MAG: hypothetical protein ABSF80_06015 [Chitinispirillaceae bacterium]
MTDKRQIIYIEIEIFASGRCMTEHILKEEGSEVVTKCDQLKLEASDGKKYLTDGTGRENGEEGGEWGELSAPRTSKEINDG